MEIVGTQGHVAVVVEQHLPHGSLQGFFVHAHLAQIEACFERAHTAVDVRSDGAWDNHVRIGGYHATHGGVRAGVEIGRCAGACTGVHAGEVQQLLNGFVFKSEVVGQQDIGLCVRVANVPAEGGGFHGDAVLLEVLDEASEIGHDVLTAKGRYETVDDFWRDPDTIGFEQQYSKKLPLYAQFVDGSIRAVLGGGNATRAK